MKIDLHMHTKKVLKSESNKRSINDANKFEKILINASVGVAAITNHNEFNLEQFNDFKSDKYLLLPGIEYDVNIGSNGNIIRRQLNVIWDPNDVENFNKLVQNNNSSTEKPIHIDKIFESFDSQNTIFYLDYKQGKPSWKMDDYEVFFIKKSIKGIELFDANNQKMHFILMAHSYKSLIGSDLNNWDEYVDKDSKKLIDSKLNIKSYESFLSILKGDGDLKIIQEVRGETNLKDILINNDKSKIKNIPLTKGVNIIFGPKSTGKTDLLKGIFNQYKEKHKCLLYESKDYGEEFNKLIVNKNNENFNKELEDFNKYFNKIVEHKEELKIDFQNFYYHFNNRGDIIIQNLSISNIAKPNIAEIIEASKNQYNSHQELIKIIEDNTLKKRHIELYDDTRKYLKDKFIKKYKDYFSYKVIDKIKDAIGEILKNNKGQVPLPTKVGLFSTFEKRDRLWKNIDEFKKIKKESTIKLGEFNVPRGNKWIHEKKLILFDPDKKDSFNGNIDCRKNKDLREFRKNFEKEVCKLFNSSRYSNPLNYVDKMIEAKKTFSFYIIKSKIKPKDEPHDKEPSNGEKAYMVLFSKLNKNYDAYFLDEPGTFLGNEMISKDLIYKLKELVLNNKIIVITTHRSSIGINTLPFNYIYRDFLKWKNGIFKTYFGNLNKDQKLKSTDDNEEIDLINKLFNYFEGSIDQFAFRKGIYENNQF